MVSGNDVTGLPMSWHVDCNKRKEDVTVLPGRLTVGDKVDFTFRVE
jgi:hypothetical protein